MAMTIDDAATRFNQALYAIVPQELRDQAEAIEDELHALYPTVMDLCERAIATTETVNGYTASAERALTNAVHDDHARSEVADAAWKITNAISGVTRILNAMYAIRDLLAIAPEVETVDDFHAKIEAEGHPEHLHEVQRLRRAESRG